MYQDSMDTPLFQPTGNKAIKTVKKRLSTFTTTPNKPYTIFTCAFLTFLMQIIPYIYMYYSTVSACTNTKSPRHCIGEDYLQLQTAHLLYFSIEKRKKNTEKYDL